jgi:hypothetical protein
VGFGPGEPTISDEGRFRRRTFLAAAGGVTLSAALAALPGALAEHGWLDEAAAAEADLTRDTINGLVAFVAPGDDEYSVAQGVSRNGPGGIAAGATGAAIDTFDRAIPAPFAGPLANASVPVSGAIAELLNNYAREVNPVAARGAFASPFARLSFEEKVEVFRRYESDPRWEGTPIHSLANTLLVFPAYLTFSEAGAFEGGRLTGAPVGWQITRYAGPSDGWSELKGYWQGRRAATNAHRVVRHRHRRRRGRRRRRRGRTGRRA